jgi:hypothetical protein
MDVRSRASKPSLRAADAGERESDVRRWSPSVTRKNCRPLLSYDEGVLEDNGKEVGRRTERRL